MRIGYWVEVVLRREGTRIERNPSRENDKIAKLSSLFFCS